MLRINNLTVDVNGHRVLKDFNLQIRKGESHVVMGPNGSGKSSLLLTIMGHPRYKILEGYITFEGRKIESMPTDERAKLGLFLGFQHPQEIPGMTLGNFLRQTANIHENLREGKHLGPAEFYPVAKQIMQDVGLTENFIGRGINEGLSGGEKKRAELAQLLSVRPKLAMLDEIDSGLDVDALKQVAKLVTGLRKETDMGLLLVTHHQKLMHHLPVDRVHLMIEGKIVQTGGNDLVEQVEKEGYIKWK